MHIYCQWSLDILSLGVAQSKDMMKGWLAAYIFCLYIA